MVRPPLFRSTMNWLRPAWRVDFLGRAHQRDHVVGVLRAGGPDFLAVDAPPAIDLSRARAHGGEIGARSRFAHADAEIGFAARDAGKKAQALFLRAEAQQQRPALPVSHPMRAHRRARREHFLQHHIAFGIRARVPAIFLRPCHAEPAARAQRLAEFGIVPRPRTRPAHRGHFRNCFPEKRAHIGAQRFGLRRQIIWREKKFPHLCFCKPELAHVDRAGAETALAIGEVVFPHAPEAFVEAQCGDLRPARLKPLAPALQRFGVG